MCSNNLREISASTDHQGGDFNVFHGLKVHGAPEFVLVGGKVAVYEYQLNSSLGAGKKIELPAYPPTLYDAMDDFAKSTAAAAVSRDSADEVDARERERKMSEASNADPMLGVTTPRRSMDHTPRLNQRLGVYQRPVSAHGVRNQQDSTFSLSGGTPDEGARKASVKVNAPPGGGGRGNFW